MKEMGAGHTSQFFFNMQALVFQVSRTKEYNLFTEIFKNDTVLK